MSTSILLHSRPLSDDLVKRIAKGIVDSIHAVNSASFLAQLALIDLCAISLKVGIEHEYDEGGQDLFICDLGRDLSDPSTKGNGAKILNMLCSLVDAHGLTMSISHMTDEPGLGTYYARFGFVAEDHPEHITNMSRAPVRPENSTPIGA